MQSPRRLMRSAALGLAVAAVAIACVKVPYTGRRQYNLIPDSLMRSIGKATYTSMLDGKVIQKKGESASTLTRVGNRISAVANKPKYQWSYKLIDEDTINAWCLPGGYIGFYTGILPALQNEAGMAFVMGHEVGHATAHHGAERMSQRLTVLGGMGGLYLYLDKKSKLSTEQKALIVGALGVGATFGVLLPFSRAHESEADVIGMMYMANAGYPPDESVKVWDRMGQLSGGGGMPTFLSTHPSHKQRQKKLREWMPRANKKYTRNKLPGDMKKVLWSGLASSGGAKASTSTKSSSAKTSTKPATSSSGSSKGGGKPANQDRSGR